MADELVTVAEHNEFEDLVDDLNTLDSWGLEPTLYLAPDLRHITRAYTGPVDRRPGAPCQILVAADQAALARAVLEAPHRSAPDEFTNDEVETWSRTREQEVRRARARSRAGCLWTLWLVFAAMVAIPIVWVVVGALRGP